MFHGGCHLGCKTTIKQFLMVYLMTIHAQSGFKHVLKKDDSI